MSVLTDRQLAAQVSGWKRKREAKEKPTVFGVRTDLEYTGAATITVDNEIYQVKSCRSDLEARELLSDEQTKGSKTVLLFRIPHDRIGPDLLARFAAQRLLPIDPTSTLIELFGAKTIDPRISNHRSLIEALVQKATQGDSYTSRAGVLDADLAWSILLDMPEFADGRPDLIRLLRMSRTQETWQPIESLPTEIAPLFFQWIGERFGSALKLIGAAIVEQGTPAELLLPIGLSLGPLFRKCETDEASIRAKALTRLEAYVGNHEIDKESARLWNDAAVAAISGMPPAELRTTASQVDKLLIAIKAESIAPEVILSKRGLNACFDILGETINSFLRRKELNGLDDLNDALTRLEAHRLAEPSDNQNRVEQTRMAARIALWTKRELDIDSQEQLSVQMLQYFRDSSYVDRAIGYISDSDARSEMEKAFQKVRKLASERRIAEQQKMAQSIAQWNASQDKEDILKVEDVIEKVVAPLAKEQKTLLLVLDGMSCAVFSQLIEDLTQRDWFTIAPESGVQPVLAAIPSVTAISRKALFSGKVDASDKRTEAVAFSENQTLAPICTKAKPRLFLKGELSEPGHSTLSDEVRDCLENSKHQVISILLNVVDDQLSGSDQLKIDWKIETIRYLSQILESAGTGERTVILTSDHGNVIELNQSRKIGEKITGGDRYREDGDIVDPEHEMRMSGKRIEQATGKAAVITAVTDQVRYANKKAGYHGGCSDMEVVIPLTVLQKDVNTAPAGWDFVDLVAPQWWSLNASNNTQAEPKKTTSPRKKRKKQEATVEANLNLELSLGEDSTPITSDWVESLLNSPVFEAQLNSLGRTPPKKALIQTFLTVMDQRKGAAPMNLLATEMGLPAMRLRGMTAQLRRLFNIDGYEIVAEQSETARITFDQSMALKQFGIK